MVTFEDPEKCFAPLEVVERLLEIRRSCGFTETVFLSNTFDLLCFFDAYGFYIYALSDNQEEMNFGNYRSPLAPGGLTSSASVTAH